MLTRGCHQGSTACLKCRQVYDGSVIGKFAQVPSKNGGCALLTQSRDVLRTNYFPRDPEDQFKVSLTHRD